MHDSLLKHLKLDLSVPRRPLTFLHEEPEEPPRPAPTPSELRTCVSGVLQRGARLQGMTLSFQKLLSGGTLPPQEREEQL